MLKSLEIQFYLLFYYIECIIQVGINIKWKHQYIQNGDLKKNKFHKIISDTQNNLFLYKYLIQDNNISNYGAEFCCKCEPLNREKSFR